RTYQLLELGCQALETAAQARWGLSARDRAGQLWLQALVPKKVCPGVVRLVGLRQSADKVGALGAEARCAKAMQLGQAATQAFVELGLRLARCQQLQHQEARLALLTAGH